jgi:hypothetical protein
MFLPWTDINESPCIIILEKIIPELLFWSISGIGYSGIISELLFLYESLHK